ncbi:MAG TPA: UDP-N-acetylglucosamine 4,6-dehydratase (inverting) [Candidatus Paceibacterota bacterium]
MFYTFAEKMAKNLTHTAVLKDKVILITGGTGFLGQKLIQKLLDIGTPRKIIIFSRDEFKQHEMGQSLSDPKGKLRFFLGDVRDLARLERAFKGVDIVIHAAALKQVPALEYNPLEAIKTNILGTQNVIDAALNNNVKKVLLVSTDKAVNPVNLYGATKLCAERLLVAANAYRKNEKIAGFSVVRYGNVIGSRGSIVEILERQKDSGLVTLTDKRMTRFWITGEGAVELVLDALSLMKGGEIFIPKLKAMMLKDLLKTVAPNCKVKIIGIRPGEKIHETLLTSDEVRRTRDIKNHYLIEPEHDWWKTEHLKNFSYVPTDFSYTSDKVRHLKPEELKSMLTL